ncbi:MAG TPA: hypothetical protein DCE41_09870 [Cytophagales bacterium]|nr:hypothetical protein [Cytophagales bacterium]HAA22206.1 hypothetical protein [Cytophagales bacterium]HAP63009.1 hypothetical protein [Cytophagales bacterium]
MFEEQQSGLSAQFLDAIEEKLGEIQQSPQHYQLRYRNVRTANLGRFLYGIHFILEEAVIRVFAVLHHKQDYS